MLIIVVTVGKLNPKLFSDGSIEGLCFGARRLRYAQDRPRRILNDLVRDSALLTDLIEKTFVSVDIFVAYANRHYDPIIVRCESDVKKILDRAEKLSGIMLLAADRQVFAAH
jgi:hypothetical protein